MQRTMRILLPILLAFSMTGLAILLTRVGPLSARLRTLDVRRTIKSAVADHTEARTEEIPA
jgi:hypothetical protein